MDNEKIESKDLVSIIPLDTEAKAIAEKIVGEQDISKLKNLTDLFNLNQAKKNAIRVLKLNSLLDKVSDQMIERVEKRPDEFSDSDLLSYLQVTQSAIDRAQKSIALVDMNPAITLNQVNIKVDESINLDRESRDKVTDAVKAILKKLNMKDDASQFTEEEQAEIIEQPINIVDTSNKNNLLNDEEGDK